MRTWGSLACVVLCLALQLHRNVCAGGSFPACVRAARGLGAAVLMLPLEGSVCPVPIPRTGELSLGRRQDPLLSVLEPPGRTGEPGVGTRGGRVGLEMDGRAVDVDTDGTCGEAWTHVFPCTVAPCVRVVPRRVAGSCLWTRPEGALGSVRAALAVSAPHFVLFGSARS